MEISAGSGIHNAHNVYSKKRVQCEGAMPEPVPPNVELFHVIGHLFEK